MTPTAETSTEALLANAGWMRALALGLVRDPHAADDVAQDAALVALLHPPPAGAALRPWLGQVVRRLAWRRARSQRRRAEREAQAREPAGPGDVGDTLARLDLQRALLEAVRELEEPLRTTLVQRYFEGRSAADIAISSGVPASTVRARVARGIELLRERLDRETGSRGAWMALVAPLVPRELLPTGATAGAGAITASTFVQGALTMTLAKIALVTSVAVVGGLAWWNLSLDRTDAAPVALAQPAAVELVDASAREAKPTAAAPAIAERSAAAAPEATPDPAAPAVAAAEPARLGRFDARVVDADGNPWVGAELAAHVQARDPGPVSARATTGSDGRAELEVELPRFSVQPDGTAATAFALVVRRAGCATRNLEVVVHQNRTTHLGEIVLLEAGSVRGRVVDEHGAAVADARVGALAAPAFEALDERARERIVRVGSSVLDGLLVRSVRPDGTFELDDVAPGPVHLWAHAPGRRYALTGPVDVVAGDTAPEVVLELPLLAETDRIAGRVVGPDGRGRPASLGVDVGRGAERKVFFVQADMEGRFEFAVEEVDAVYALTAHDGHEEFTPRRVDGVRPGDLEVTIALGLGTRLAVRVADVDGAAVPGADFHILTSTVIYSAKATALEPGEYELDLPDGAFQVEVAAAGFRQGHSALFEAGAVPSEILVVLSRAARVRGIVTAAGAPLAGAKVEAFEFDARGVRTVNGLRCVVSPFTRGTTVADDQGRFELNVDSDGPIVVRASAAGWMDAESEPFELLPDAGGPLLELALGPGGAIEGRVLVPAGESAAGRVVGAHRGDGRAISTRASEAGTYRFDGLMPGHWHVFPLAEEYRPHEGTYSSTSSSEPLPWSCRVEESRTTRFDLQFD